MHAWNDCFALCFPDSFTWLPAVAESIPLRIHSINAPSYSSMPRACKLSSTGAQLSLAGWAHSSNAHSTALSSVSPIVFQLACTGWMTLLVTVLNRPCVRLDSTFVLSSNYCEHVVGHRVSTRLHDLLSFRWWLCLCARLFNLMSVYLSVCVSQSVVCRLSSSINPSSSIDRRRIGGKCMALDA
jgi:hypothetical protein